MNCLIIKFSLRTVYIYFQVAIEIRNLEVILNTKQYFDELGQYADYRFILRKLKKTHVIILTRPNV